MLVIATPMADAFFLTSFSGGLDFVVSYMNSPILSACNFYDKESISNVPESQSKRLNMCKQMLCFRETEISSRFYRSLMHLRQLGLLLGLFSPHARSLQFKMITSDKHENYEET